MFEQILLDAYYATAVILCATKYMQKSVHMDVCITLNVKL